MRLDIKGILEGAFNSVIVNEKVEEISKERLTICAVCPHDSVKKKELDPNYKTLRPDEHCTICGCNLHMKTRSLSQKCPDNPPRWEETMTEQEEWKIDVMIEEEKRVAKDKDRNKN